MVEVQDVDYNLLSLEEQIKVDLDTDVMVRMEHDNLCWHITLLCYGMMTNFGDENLCAMAPKD